ncbi:hypothetical protein [Tabrizicola flagellatus]|uniref:hypothetical protein n=1 Tax=Tabrizicola flagellatus TaxID=2593021 RepID=UPI0039190667
MKADKTTCDYDLRAGRVGYINTTSTCDCGLRAGYACEPVRTLMFARAKITPEQRLAP